MKKMSVFLSAYFFIFAVSNSERYCAYGSQDTAQEQPFQLKATIEIQGQRALYSNGTADNLDALFGRFNLGGFYSSPTFYSGFNIRAYPEEFGYEALSGVTLDYWFWEIESEKTTIAKFQVEQAWARFMLPYGTIQIGRFYTCLSNSLYYGNYLDVSPGGSFMNRLAYHNATEFVFSYGIVQSSVLLGVGDIKLNRGYLRAVETVKPLETVEISFGYRGNVFDLIRYGDERVDNRFYGQITYDIAPGLATYFEVASLQSLKPIPKLSSQELWEKYLVDTISKVNDFKEYVKWYYNTYYPKIHETKRPILFGLTFPTAPYLDYCALEMEYMDKRTVGGQDRPIDVAFILAKSVGSHFKAYGALGSDPQADEIKHPLCSVRLTAFLK